MLSESTLKKKTTPTKSMGRYFSRRLIGIHLLALVAIGVCFWLANWQWNKATYVKEVTPTNGIVEFEKLSVLRDFLPPSSVGVPTAITGVWQVNSRLEFPGRPIDGAQLINPDADSEAIVSWAVPIGTWIVDILKLESGGHVGVVRGWTQNPELVPAPSGSVTLSGVMQPSEDAPSVSLFKLPSYITTPVILAKSESSLHDGYFVSTTPTEGLELVKPIYDTPLELSVQWRNVIYTFNWIIFGLIILGMWWRIIQDEVKLQSQLANEEN
jgi:hypothetical protein